MDDARITRTVQSFARYGEIGLIKRAPDDLHAEINGFLASA
jgi:hypothetical protein